jgi:hypothetical protein
VARSDSENHVSVISVPVATDNVYWFIGNFQSVVVLGADASPSSLEAASDFSSFCEYLAWRRGVLTYIQRGTLRNLVEQRSVSRRQIADWVWQVTAATDTYVIAGWRWSLWDRALRASRDSIEVRDLDDLDGQVARNLDGFTSRFDAQSTRLSLLLGVVFGIVAATSLLPLIDFAFAWAIGQPSTQDLGLRQPALYSFVLLLVFAVLAGGSIWLVRKTRAIAPPRKGVAK